MSEIEWREYHRMYRLSHSKSKRKSRAKYSSRVRTMRKKASARLQMRKASIAAWRVNNPDKVKKQKARWAKLNPQKLTPCPYSNFSYDFMSRGREYEITVETAQKTPLDYLMEKEENGSYE